MAEFTGTIITSPVGPPDTADNISSHIDVLGTGGYRVVSDIAELMALPPVRLKKGMIAYVLSEGREYRLDDADSKTWVIIPGGGGAGTADLAVTVTATGIQIDGGGVPAIIPFATDAQAGIMTPEQVTKIKELESYGLWK